MNTPYTHRILCDWIDGSASAAATQTPILDSDTATTINFGSGFIAAPNTSTANPTSTADAVSATAGSQASAAPTTQLGDFVTQAAPYLPVIIGVGVGSIVLLVILKHHKLI